MLYGTLGHVNRTRVGYARCPTDEQDVIIQTERLLALGVPEDRIHIDRGFSGTTRRNRAGLAAIYDWNDPFGRLFLQTLAMVAEFEANLRHMRTREGMALAKKNGKLKDKQPQLPEPARLHPSAELDVALHPRSFSAPTAVPGFPDPGSGADNNGVVTAWRFRSPP
ncbi:recombinase family protein [Nonomuraea guangzhouensis]|uniref:Recombinase family protein n=1 Tax=Nonomuraea guangzhouensis TaxID=1291555 RepID=A0ABW4G5Y4_9ACTN|nr:recombinase family protein [Nonomuraea guangzhouensis]